MLAHILHEYLIPVTVYVHYSRVLQLRDISMAPDMDPQKRNVIIYDMNSGTKFTLTAAKSSVREQWLSHSQKLIQVSSHAHIHAHVYMYNVSHVYKYHHTSYVCTHVHVHV